MRFDACYRYRHRLINVMTQAFCTRPQCSKFSITAHKLNEAPSRISDLESMFLNLEVIAVAHEAWSLPLISLKPAQICTSPELYLIFELYQICVWWSY